MTAALLALATVSTLHLPVSTLDGKSKTFPQDASATRAIFVVTFGKSASEQGRAWSERLQAMKGSLSADVFSVAVLEGVPKMFRSIAQLGISRSVPAALHGHFWIAETGAKEWQECTSGDSAKEAYVFVLDQRSRIVWRARSAVTEEKIRELSALPAP